MSQTLDATRNGGGARWASIIALCALLITAYVVVGAASANPGHATLRVPTVQYPTIQSAINAAHSGDTILVAPGTYTEQLTIPTSVNLVGSGPGRTIIQSPSSLAVGSGIVEITNGATVSFTGFTVSFTVGGLAGVLVSGATATIYGNSIQGTTAGSIGVAVEDSSVATITSNVVVATATPTDAGEFGIFVEGSLATITLNSIEGPGGVGVYLTASTATVEYNAISQFSCTYNQVLLTYGYCGPSWASQTQGGGIFDSGDAGIGTTIAYNVVSTADAGIGLDANCPNCVVKGNVILNSFDYGLACFDGACAFGPNIVIGGAYGVGAAAALAVTTVTLSHVLIIDPSVAPLYYENDYGQPPPTIGGTYTVVG
jgi:parallel beta helix pectate lyase-like protein